MRIFSSDAYDISESASAKSDDFLNLAAELPKVVTANYRPINWHKDFHSGSEWLKQYWYFDRRLRPKSGSEIKIPWELSKFVHVGVLAHGDQEVGAHEFILQAMDWMACNQRFHGVNWSSELVVALRAANWIFGIHLFKPILKRYPKTLRLIASSLYDHRLYLQRNLAYHETYSDDHYLGDLVGLLFICAAFPEFPESDRWLLFAILGMEEEMKRQVLDDGYSHMMSSHYHRFVGELFVSGASLLERLPTARRIRLNEVKPASAWPYVEYPQGRIIEAEGRLLSREFYDKLMKMGLITAAMTKPNGLVPQLGDNDSARLHRFFDSVVSDDRDHSALISAIEQITGSKLLENGQQIITAEAKLITGGLPTNPDSPRSQPRIANFGVMHFPGAGIGVIKKGPFHLVATCSPNGYRDGKGGHGHNDKLSFELNVNGEDFIVDGGCPFYTSDPESRNAYRSTRAHSTIQVEGLEQDPLPSDPFSLPQRCSIMLERRGEWGLEGHHTGYDQPHRRRFEVFEDRIEIHDSLAEVGERYLSFNLAPKIAFLLKTVEGSDSIRFFLISDKNTKLTVTVKGVADAQEFDGCFGLGFGRPIANKMIRCRIVNNMVRQKIQLLTVDAGLE